jgi:internalin A
LKPYVAPDLLPEKATLQEQLDREWDVANAVEETTFEYALLNQRLIRAIISRIGQEAGISAPIGNVACVLEKTSRGRAVIEQEIATDVAGRLRIQT